MRVDRRVTVDVAGEDLDCVETVGENFGDLVTPGCEAVLELVDLVEELRLADVEVEFWNCFDKVVLETALAC